MNDTDTYPVPIGGDPVSGLNPAPQPALAHDHGPLQSMAGSTAEKKRKIRKLSRYCSSSVCLSGVHCKLVQIKVYGWIVQCSGHPDTKACHLVPEILFQVPPGTEARYGFAN